jgi:hypothetical protein
MAAAAGSQQCSGVPTPQTVRRPHGAGPLATGAIIEILKLIVLGTALLHVAGLFGVTKSNKLGRTILLIAASHDKRLETILKEGGENAIYIETPSFRLLHEDVVALAEAVAAAVGC